nr:hypothetical protein Iba_chr14fCG11620 [Ipomoea batatas]
MKVIMIGTTTRLLQILPLHIHLPRNALRKLLLLLLLFLIIRRLHYTLLNFHLLRQTPGFRGTIIISPRAFFLPLKLNDDRLNVVRVSRKNEADDGDILSPNLRVDFLFLVFEISEESRKLVEAAIRVRILVIVVVVSPASLRSLGSRARAQNIHVVFVNMEMRAAANKRIEHVCI